MELLSFRKRKWIVRKRLQGWKISQICSHARIHRGTFYYHWNVYRQNGWNGLEPKSCRPHTIHRTPESIVNQVLAIRMKQGYGPDKIAGMLRLKGLETGHSSMYRFI